MATLQSGKCFTVPTFFGMCCRSEWQERMYIYKWQVDQTKHEIFCVHIVCNEIQVKVNLEITTFFFYLRFPYCPNFFWFGVVQFTQIFISQSHYLPKECVVCVGHTLFFSMVCVCVFYREGKGVTTKCHMPAQPHYSHKENFQFDFITLI